MVLPGIERYADHPQFCILDVQEIFVSSVPGVKCRARGQTNGEIAWGLALEGQNIIFVL